MSRVDSTHLRIVSCLAWLAAAIATGCSDAPPAKTRPAADAAAHDPPDANATNSVAAIQPTSSRIVVQAAKPPLDGSAVAQVAASPAAAGDAIPEWPPGYQGGKPWNRNPETPKDNHAYKLQGKRIDVTTRGGLLFVDNAGQQWVDWPKPKLALVLTGSMQGYIEPCGCSGLENMKGGLARRHALIQELEAAGWPLMLLDLGELSKRIGPQATIKYQNTIAGLRKMGYRTIGLGTSELRLAPTEVVSTIDGQTHFVSANVGLLGMDNEFTAPFRVIEGGGMKIGVTSVALPPKEQPLQNPDLALVSPAEGLKKVMPKLLELKCDQLVLLVAPTMGAQESLDEASTRQAAEELARQFPKFNLVVIATNSDPPADKLKTIAGTEAKMIELSHKSMYVGVAAFYDDAARPIRYQRVPLDARFRETDAMKELMAAYQDQLKEAGFEGLGALPRQHPHKGKFVGSQTCADCHSKAFDIWKGTPHSHALATLEKINPPRQFDPECLSCHVTGWDAKAYVPQISGFESFKKTPLLADNGCENCHGPGSEHVAAENAAADQKLMNRLRKQMQLTIDEAKNPDSPRGCFRCHDPDNSPNYKFETYWPKVEHKGKD